MNDLQYIYEILRQLKGVQLDEKSTTLQADYFPTIFLLKLLNERLTDLQELGTVLVSQIFKRLLSDHIQQQQTVQVPELEHFFHHALYYIHNFFLELDWHQANFADHLTSKDEKYISSKLPLADGFIIFQRSLDESNVRYRLETSIKPELQINSPSPTGLTAPVSSLKSSLSATSKLDSPGRKRRVRFREESLPAPKPQELSKTKLKESHSVTSLDLILYGINLLIQSLCNQLDDLQHSKSKLKLTMEQVMKSSRKLRSSQLNAIAKEIRSSNEVFLGVLSCLWQVSSQYLKKQIGGVLYKASGSLRLEAYAQRRIQVYYQKVVVEVERKVLRQLAMHCLQLTLDLIVSEINLPPVELEESLGNKSRQEVRRSRENFVNFLTSWLELEPANSNQVEDLAASIQQQQQQSTLATDTGGFKSSSRILNQMNNLEHLVAIQLSSVMEHLSKGGSPKQMEYLLQLLHLGFEEAFDCVSEELREQLVSSQYTATVAQNKPLPIDSLNKSVDSISAKVRHLKCAHIFSSLDSLIRDIASRYGLEERVSDFDSKLKAFAGSGTGVIEL